MEYKIKSSTTLDLSEDNSVLTIDEDRLPRDHKLSAINWITSSNSLEISKARVLRYFFSLISKNLPGFKLWLLIGHSAYQPDNRITRRRNIWGSLKARGIEITHTGLSYETAVKYEAKVKYFGAIELSELSVDSVIRALNEEHGSYLAVFPKSTNMGKVIEGGWVSDSDFDRDLLDRVINEKGLLLKSVGEFDDLEGGFLAVSLEELIKNLT